MLNLTMVIGAVSSGNQFLAKREAVRSAVERADHMPNWGVVAVVVVAIFLAIGLFRAWHKQQERRYDLDKNEARQDYERARFERQSTKVEEELARARADLKDAQHLIAVMRSADYVPTVDVPPMTPHVDAVFGAATVGAAEVPATDEASLEETVVQPVAEPELDVDELAAQAFGHDDSEKL